LIYQVIQMAFWCLCQQKQQFQVSADIFGLEAGGSVQNIVTSVTYLTEDICRILFL